MAAERAGGAAATGGVSVDEEAPAGACPRCGTPYRQLQEYCLDCGIRLPEDREREPAWAARAVPAGDWVWPTLVAFLVALFATVAVVTMRWTRERSDRVLVATTQMPTLAPTATAGAPLPTTTLPALPPEPPPEERRRGQTAPSGSQLADWPSGKDGWTVVVSSIPVERGPTAATAKAKEVLEAGLAQVGVLDSSRYASLHPDYFVVFSGVYDSQSDAEQALEEARDRGYDAAYVREIAP